MHTTSQYSHLSVTLPQEVQGHLLQDSYERRQMEACGVLLGQRDEGGNWHVETVLPLRNIAGSAVYFEFAPEELIEVEMNYPDQVIGVYHSHPTGYPRASDTDRQNMRRVNLEQNIPWVWLILCGPFKEGTRKNGEARRILAYYHDKKKGLQHITIQLESETELMAPDDQVLW